jgi:hypothetical protein
MKGIVAGDIPGGPPRRSPLFFDFQGDTDPTGICSGDSGGPALAIIHGREQVVGVIQGVTDPTCVGGVANGLSGRVSFINDVGNKGGRDHFIGEYLAASQCVGAAMPGADGGTDGGDGGVSGGDGGARCDARAP